jgi:hypothetical protein
MTVIEYANLSRGVLCAPGDARICRIQSTHCERKQWSSVLWSTPDEMLLSLAMGDEVVVHDCSEKDRETRACWQGLELIRWCCVWSWHPGRTYVKWPRRGGKSMVQYFFRVYSGLPDPLHRKLDYYRKFATPFTLPRLTTCWKEYGGKH